jgi:hypothetical protein
LSASVDISWSAVDHLACEVRNFTGSESEIIELIKIVSISREKYKTATKLKFVNSKFERIPKDFCQNFPNIIKLFMNNVGLTEVTRKELKLFKNLEEIHINYNKMTRFRADLFDFTPNIQKIYFMHNKINEINLEGLTKLKHLKILDLRNNTCINEKFEFTSESDILKFSKKTFKECQAHSRKRRTLLPLLWLASYLDYDDDEDDKKKQREKENWTNTITINVPQNNQQQRQREEQKRIEEEKRQQQIKEEIRKIDIARVDLDNRFRELEILIKEQAKQFEIKRQELLIEYLRILQKVIVELQNRGIHDKFKIEAKIRVIQVKLQKEVIWKYESICKSLIEKIIRESGYQGRCLFDCGF